MSPDRTREELLLEAAALDALEGREPLSHELRFLLDPVYAAEREEVSRAIAELAFAVSPREPAPSLRERLLSRVGTEPGPGRRPEGSVDVAPGVAAVRTSAASWLPAPLPGVDFKLIHRDEARGYTTRLVRFAPGVSYPKHRHGGTEEIFVLAGTVRINGTLLGPGDYCRSAEGTEEEGTFTETGATAIVVSSDRDELSA